MKVVVTGGAGMLGGGLARRLLREGHDVGSVDLRPGPPGARDTIGDVRDPATLRGVMDGADAVVHCASALPSYPREQIRSVIVDGTRGVLTAASRAGVPRVVHISSTAVYGLPATVPTPETHPAAPVDPYSRAKVEAEGVCERFRAEGLCVPVLRPKTFLGPGRMGLFAMLFEWAEEGRGFPVLGRGDVRIQMFALDDLVDAVVTVLSAPDDVAGDTYNLGAAEFGTLREDFQAVLDEAGHGRRVVSVPARPALAALRLLERLRLSPVYGRLLHKLLADSYVDIGKARRRLGFAPRMSNRDAVLQTYRWWRAERRAGSGAGGTTTGAVTATGAGAATGGARGRAGTGRTSRDPWKQGVLSLAKIFF